MREATPEERRRFYAEEWDRHEIPDFILRTLSQREFGFDLDGTGPSHRYNQFTTAEQLERFLRARAPYSTFVSVALYERPSQRKGWLKAELAFDIDAKDLPLRSCGCSGGRVCEVCLDEARNTAARLAEIMRSDLGLRDMRFAYSGRGFHLRVLDDAATTMESSERSQIVSYLTGGVVPSDLTVAFGYSRVFREFAARTFERLDEEKLSQAVRRALAKRLVERKADALEVIQKGKVEDIRSFKGMSPRNFQRLLHLLARLNLGFVDGKVTVDTKRILRLPSSLHSGVSMKCVEVRDIDRFSLEQAVPKFAREKISALAWRL